MGLGAGFVGSIVGFVVGAVVGTVVGGAPDTEIYAGRVSDPVLSVFVAFSATV